MKKVVLNWFGSKEGFRARGAACVIDERGASPRSAILDLATNAPGRAYNADAALNL